MKNYTHIIKEITNINKEIKSDGSTDIDNSLTLKGIIKKILESITPNGIVYEKLNNIKNYLNSIESTIVNNKYYSSELYNKFNNVYNELNSTSTSYMKGKINTIYSRVSSIHSKIQSIKQEIDDLAN